jgi:FkbM family methyltransferase
MKYLQRSDVEKIGRCGAHSYIDVLDGKPIRVSRQLSSYWVASNLVDKGMSEHLMEDGFWEAWITLWISRFVANSVCIDAGANYGYFTFQLAKNGCKVYAIDANPSIIPFLKHSSKLNGCENRVEIMNYAISNKSGDVVELGLTENTLNTSVLVSRRSEYGVISVNTLALNDIDDKIDFIKMDIEGAEELAFDGMLNIWDKNPDCVLLMEFVPPQYEKNGLLFFEKIISNGFNIGYVDYDGNEQHIADFSFFESDDAPFRMLVIRKQK